MNVNHMRITAVRLDPEMETMSWENIQEWAADDPNGYWGEWTEKKVWEHNAECRQRAEDGEWALQIRLEAFSEPVDFYLKGRGFTPTKLPTSKGAQMVYRSKWMKADEEVGDDLIDTVIGTLEQLKGGGFARIFIDDEEEGTL